MIIATNRRADCGRVVRTAVSVLVVSSMLSACAANGTGTGGTGQKEEVGTAAGAVLGGLAGAFLGKGSGKVVAVLAGAAIGGLIGNRIGAMLDEEDQKALQAQANQALLTQPDNAQINWASQRSGATATVVPENTRVEQRQIKVVRDANVAPAPQLDLIGAKYAAKSTTNIRNAPSVESDVTGSVAGGSTIWAVGKVHDQPWIMVARGGKSIGYVTASNLAPAPAVPTTFQSAAAKPTPVVQTAVAKPSQVTASAQPAAAPFDLDGPPPVRTPADLDALGPTEKADVVVASVTCRDIKTTASAKGETATSSQTACKSPDGSWVLN